MQPKGAGKAAGEDGKTTTHQKQQQQQRNWTSKYKCGHPFLQPLDFKRLGPGCTALHAHSMKDCVDNVKNGILVRFKGTYMLSSSDPEVGLVRYDILYDLFNFGTFDSMLLRCLTLSLAVEAKNKNIPVGFLDPQTMSLDSIKFDRDQILLYMQKAFTKYAKKDFIMFAYNSSGLAGGHWIVVIVIQNWNKVIYLDSNRSGNHDFSILKLLIDEAFATHTNKMKDRPQPLTHATKYACQQQSSAKGSSCFAAHHLILAMKKEFEVLTTPIDTHSIREKLAMFLMTQVIDKKGEFNNPS